VPSDGAQEGGRPPWSWRLRLAPILCVQIYLLLTELAFAFSPWEYDVSNWGTLVGFLAICHVSLTAGYLTAASGGPAGYSGGPRVRTLLLLSLAANLALVVPTAISRAGLGGAEALDVGLALADPGAAYSHSQTVREATLAEYARILLGPLLVAMVPLAVFYHRAFRASTKVLVGLATLANVATYVLTGTNKGVADVVLVLPWLLVAGDAARFSRLGRFGRALLAGGTVVGLGVFFIFFQRTQSLREGSASAYGYLAGAKATANYDHFTVRYLPKDVQVGVLGLNSYATQGYYALSLALEEPFVPMWGAGNSIFLFRQVARLLNDPSFAERSYPFRIERYGWNAYGLWSTIYPWLASDVSFPGVFVVLFILGRVFARCWLDVLSVENPFAVILLWQFVLMFLYFPANNQVMQSGEAFVAFLGTIAAWRLTRRAPVTGVRALPERGP
jgi:hypothetical protein